MAKNHLILLLVAVATSFVASSATLTRSNSNAAPTVYEMLAKYNFPPGILPDSVQNYTINEGGSFDVTLGGECQIDVRGFTLRYQSKIQGNIQPMVINGLGLEGISVNLGINHVGINSVERDGDQLKFSAGLISKSFPVGSFAKSPRCNPGPGSP